jgi:hypothetical protein
MRKFSIGRGRFRERLELGCVVCVGSVFLVVFSGVSCVRQGPGERWVTSVAFCLEH